MSKQNVNDLIQHIQNVVGPTNKMPDVPNNENFTDHPRPNVPDWIPSQVPDVALMSPDEEIIFEPDNAETQDIDTSTVETNSNPDSYAYYLPFHFYKDRWGIYIKASGVLAISAYLYELKKLGHADSLITNSVYQMLLGHETFHHKVELACSRLETPGIEILRKGLGPEGSVDWYIYSTYFWDTEAGLHEEAMANAHAQKSLANYYSEMEFAVSETQAIQYLVSSFMEKQPAGYRDFGNHLSADKFNNGKDLIIKHMSDSYYNRVALTSHPDSLLSERKYFLDKSVSACPVYLILDTDSLLVQRVRPFPVMFNMRIKVHTREHEPPHFHLEKPVGKEIWKYTWPELKPLNDSKKLSGNEERVLHKYINHIQPAIYKKIKSVYPGVSDI